MKADCESLLFHKSTFARRERQMPAFEALLTPGRATATILHVPQLSAPSSHPALTLPLPVAVLAPRLLLEALPPPRKQQGESGKWAGIESSGNCLLMGAAPIARQHQQVPQPRDCETAHQGTECDGGVLLSPAKPAWLQVGIPQAELGIISGSSRAGLSGAAGSENRSNPRFFRSAGRGLGALHAADQHHALELGASGSQGFSPHPTH